MRQVKHIPVVGAVALIVATLPAGAAVAASKKTTTTTGSQPVAVSPAATGQIAYISGKTLEVRNLETGQTTVDITPKTRITATVAVSLKSVVPGACVTASGTKAKDGALDATTVTLSAATGECSQHGGARFFGAGGGGGFRPPSSAGGARRRFSVPANSAVAFGKVTSVAGSAIGIDGTMFTFSPAQSSRPRARATSAPKPEKISVVVSTKTLYLRTGPASASALRVGECATAFGPTNNIGAVTATRLSVSPATSAGCFAGLGGGFRFGGSVGRSPGQGA